MFINFRILKLNPLDKRKHFTVIRLNQALFISIEDSNSLT